MPALTATHSTRRTASLVGIHPDLASVAVIGAGYVGLATAAMLGTWGKRVVCFERDRERARSLAKACCPIEEPRLPEMLRTQLDGGALTIRSEIDVRDASLVFICVGTPPAEDGGADLADLFDAVDAIGVTMQPGATVVVKSTVPVGTCDKVEERLDHYLPPGTFSVLSNPEFLRQGRIIDDTERPDRIVIGAREPSQADVLVRLYRVTGAPIRVCDRRTAELAKYAANAFLATKVSFINEIAHLAEALDADVTQVADAIGMDRRIGRDFLNAGIGYGGSCLPKDIRAIRHSAGDAECPTPLLDAVSTVNDEAPGHFVRTIDNALGGVPGKKVAILGLTFKPQTTDCRASVAIEVARLLEDDGAHVAAFDPAMKNPEFRSPNGAFPAMDAYDACFGAHAVVIATEWPEFAALDWKRIARGMAAPFVFDGRNLCEPEAIEASGLRYYGVGRARLNGHMLANGWSRNGVS